MNTSTTIYAVILAMAAGGALLPAATTAEFSELNFGSADFSDRQTDSWLTSLQVSSQSAAVAAESNTEGGSDADLAGKATDPTAPLIQLQLQNVFIPSSHHADGYANQFIVQPVIPFEAMGGLPRSILRPTFPVVTTTDVNGGSSRTSGLGDISWVYAFALDKDWGTFGFGGAGAIPTATDARLGARKWTIGPSLLFINTSIPKWQIGALIYNTWSIGGSGKSNVNQLAIQPIVTYHFDDGWYGGLGDSAWTYNWDDKSDKMFLPMSLRLGRVFSIGDQKVNVFIQPHYNFGDDIAGKDVWGLKLNLTFLFPE